MSGTHITNHQIRLFMQSKQDGKKIKVAAARAGFSERSAYRIQNPKRKLKAEKRSWKTRLDPFEDVWEKRIGKTSGVGALPRGRVPTPLGAIASFLACLS